MTKLEKMNSLLNCQFCSCIFTDPIVLPCGETVCQVHTEEICASKCIFCQKKHTAPQHGFPSNKVLKNQLELEANKLNLIFSQFSDFKRLLADMNKRYQEIEQLSQDPESFISDYFTELTRQVDLRKENLIEDIGQYSYELIQKIDSLKKECLLNSRNASKSFERNAEGIRERLDKLNDMFSSYMNDKKEMDLNDKKLEEMISQKESSQIVEMMGRVLNQKRFQLNGNKFYNFLPSDIRVETMFGSINTSDYDIENTTVSSFLLFALLILFSF